MVTCVLVAGCELVVCGFACLNGLKSGRCFQYSEGNVASAFGVVFRRIDKVRLEVSLIATRVIVSKEDWFSFVMFLSVSQGRDGVLKT